MATDNDDRDALANATAEEFLTTLKRQRRTLGDNRSLDNLERIKQSFAASREGKQAEASYPDFNGFQIREKIGEGGFGIVYRADDTTLSREVAIKVMIDRASTRSNSVSRGKTDFIGEARALARVNHENVLKIFSILETDCSVAFVMELVDGRTLDDIVVESGTLGPSEVGQIGVVMTRALAAVHDVGLVHRDIKPSNIMRAAGGKYILTDFGQGTFLASQLQDDGLVAGTPLYMSPEQVRGAPVDVRSDIYSLGVTLYYLAAGEPPTPISEDTDIIELFKRITEGKTIPLRDRRPDYPEKLVDVIERAISRAPEDRFRSAGDMERALCKAILRPTSLRRMGRRAILQWLLGGLAALGLAVGGLLTYLSAIPFEVKFWRIEADAPQPLDRGSELSVGDKFYLEFYSRRQVYAYLIMRTEESARIVFPDSEAGLSNPVPEDVARRLPAAPGEAWQVNDVGDGVTEFYLVASLQPLLHLESVLNEPSGLSLRRGPVEPAPITDDPVLLQDVILELLAEVERHPNRTEFDNDCWYEKRTLRVRESQPTPVVQSSNDEEKPE